VVTVLLTSLARALVQESALGISKGHAPTRSFVEASLRFFEAHQQAPAALAQVLGAQKSAARTAGELKLPAAGRKPVRKKRKA
jgi:hypothetical protein